MPKVFPDEEEFPENQPWNDAGYPSAPPAPTGGPPVDPGATPGPIDFGQFQLPQYEGPSSPDFGGIEGAPEFIPPEFLQPSLEDAMNEPGYRFRLSSGLDALQNSASAKGMSRTGGAWKDLINYAQSFATQEYGNVFNRAKSMYDTKFAGASANYAPKFASWQFLSAAEKERALAEFNRYFDSYQSNSQNQLQLEQWIQNLMGGGGPPQPPG